MEISQKVKKSAQKAKIFKIVAIVSPMRKYPQSPDSFFFIFKTAISGIGKCHFFFDFYEGLNGV